MGKIYVILKKKKVLWYVNVLQCCFILPCVHFSSGCNCILWITNPLGSQNVDVATCKLTAKNQNTWGKPAVSFVAVKLLFTVAYSLSCCWYCVIVLKYRNVSLLVVWMEHYAFHLFIGWNWHCRQIVNRTKLVNSEHGCSRVACRKLHLLSIYVLFPKSLHINLTVSVYTVSSNVGLIKSVKSKHPSKANDF